MFFKKNKKDNAIKKIDKIITGIIIGGAVAGAIGMSKTKKGKEITKKASEVLNSKTNKKLFNKILSILGKIAIFGISLLKKK